MPLEIRELVIKVNISELPNNTATDAKNELLELKEKVVSECIERVMKKLETNFQR